MSKIHYIKKINTIILSPILELYLECVDSNLIESHWHLNRGLYILYLSPWYMLHKTFLTAPYLITPFNLHQYLHKSHFVIFPLNTKRFIKYNLMSCYNITLYQCFPNFFQKASFREIKKTGLLQDFSKGHIFALHHQLQKI